MPKASTSKRTLDSAFSGTGHSLSSSAPPPKAIKIAPLFSKAAPPTKDRWLPALDPSCFHLAWGEPTGAAKVAAFDLDGTVIEPKEGRKWPRDETDWKWLNGKVVQAIRDAHERGYAIVFISNQAGRPKVQESFKLKIPLIGRQLKVPFHAFAAFGYDHFRKPATGMWDAYVQSCNDGIKIDLEQSFYCGDAAGRSGDHSDTDRKFAANAGLVFHTPEEYFLSRPVDSKWALSGWNAKNYDHDLPLYTPTLSPIVPRYSDFAQPKPEVVLFVGLPASGKSHLYKTYFEPASYVHINQDTLKTRPACLALLRASLSASPPRSCVVDNTNPAAATRAEYVRLVRDEFPGVRIRAFHFTASLEIAKHNSVFRAVEGGRQALPLLAFSSYLKNFRAPSMDEGFDEVKQITFKFTGDEDAKARWSRWLNVYPTPK